MSWYIVQAVHAVRAPGLSLRLPTESERAAELGAALEAAPAPARAFDLRDPKHFPPMRPERPERADPAAH